MKILLNNLSAALRGGLTLLKSLQLTLSMTAAMLITALLSLPFPLLEWLCFDYYAVVEQHQYWRFITAHFIHSSASHLFWDLTAFFLLSGYLEYQDRRTLIFGLITGGGLIAGFLLSPYTDIQRYSGISGLIYTILILALWRWSKTLNNRFLALLPVSVIAGKTLLEWQNAAALFVANGWSVFVEAHLLGMIAGLAVIFVLSLQRTNKLLKL